MHLSLLPTLALLASLLVACGAPAPGAADPAVPSARDDAARPDDPAPAASDAGPRIPFATWAAKLVDHPRARNGERDAIVADWFELLASEPGHPLAEGTLALLAAVEPDLEHPQRFREQVLALDAGAGFTPLAEGLLRQLQARARARSESVGALPEQLFHASADRALVLGPLPPARDPLALASNAELLVAPDFDAAVPGLDGEPVRWRPLERSGELGRLQVSSVLDAGAAWLLLALEVDLPGGGPGFVELDLGGSAGASSAGGAHQLFAFGGSDFRGFVHGADAPPPSFAWSHHGGAPQVVDMGTGERSGRVLLPVVFRDGVNRVVLRLPGAGIEHFGVRALDPQGAAWPDARWLRPGHAPGAPVAGEPPAREPLDTVGVLLAREERGPLEEALLGVLLLLDRRPALGLHHLERGAEGNHLGPKALLAGVLDRLAYLPANLRRSRARSLVDEILALDPDFFSAGVARVEQWLADDRELDALEHMRHLAERHDGHARGLLRLHALLDQLGMSAAALEVLDRARARSPESPRVLERLAEVARMQGRHGYALELEQRALEADGRSAGALERLALRHTAEGRVDRAEALWQGALERLPSRARRLRHARWLAAVERTDAAREALAALQRDFPDDPDVLVSLADVALLAGDASAEQEALRAALELVPGQRALRLRRAESPREELVRAAAERWLVGTPAALGDYDPGAPSDSVVKVLDQSYVHVFEDDVVDVITHDLLQLRDLDAVTRHGERDPVGEVIRLATLKPDGRRFEPVLVGGSYVMPNLEPGDFVEQVTRLEFRVGPGHAMRPGGWFFQSTEMPFLRSRYVISLPADHDLRMVLERFDGTHEVHEQGDRVVHVFEALDVPRLQRERGAPPDPWILPMVEFGEDADLRADHHRQLVVLRAATLPTPEIRAEVERIVARLPGDQLRARALYAFVQDHLQQRQDGRITAASTAFHTREGNASVFYAALLRAAGVEHELVFSRDVPPAADPQPEPHFLTAGRLANRLLVSVHPDDGPAVLCDPNERSLPYGELLGNAPGAEAMVLGSGRLLRLPEGDPEDTPGERVELHFTLHADGAADVEGRVRLLGPAGFATKPQFREAPDAYVRAAINGLASQRVPGLDLADAWVEGLDAPGERLALAFRGRVPRFLDGAALERELPLPAWQLTAQVSSEGARRLPFWSTALQRQEYEVTLALGAGFELAAPLPELDRGVGGLHYRFTVEEPEADVLRLHRVVSWEPFLLAADEHHELLELAARVDELERGRLTLRRR